MPRIGLQRPQPASGDRIVAELESNTRREFALLSHAWVKALWRRAATSKRGDAVKVFVPVQEDDEVIPYVRPSVEVPEFRDSDGLVIDYGRRWQGSPPDETYSVVTHPQRFAPLHTVADALIAHLLDTYDVLVTEGAEVAADLLHPVGEVSRAVRIRPNDPACAALTIVFTPYPGIRMHAGLLHDFQYPACGCDACDENWDGQADQLEEQAFAVVGGHYRESIGPGLRPWVRYALSHPGGSSAGGSRARDLPPGRVKTAKPILRALPAGWAPWPAARS